MRCAQPDGLVYRGDILPYLRASEDVTVPPGRYSIGPSNQRGVVHRVDVDRASWVTVKADQPGSVVIDGSINNSAVQFEGAGLGASKPSQRLVVAGLHFVATSVKFLSTQDISFWYTCHEYTPEQWHANAMNAAAAAGVTVPATGPKDPVGDGGGLYALDPRGHEWASIAARMGAFLPTGLRGNSGSAGASDDLRFFGVDIGPVADDGIYMGGTFDLVVQGARIHTVTEFAWQHDLDGVSVDPGPVYGSEQDQFHNDGIQIGGGGYRPMILDSWSEGRLMFNRTPNPSKSGWDLVIDRSWFGPSILANTGGSDQVKRLTDDPNFSSWTVGHGDGPWPSQPMAVVAASSSDAPKMNGSIRDVTHITQRGRPIAWQRNGTSVEGDMFPGLHVEGLAQTDLEIDDRSLFFSPDRIGSDPYNPALHWRDLNPYESLATFGGLTSSSYSPS